MYFVFALIQLKELLTWLYIAITNNHIAGVMVSVISSSVVDRGFDPQSCQTKDYAIGICSFSATRSFLTPTLSIFQLYRVVNKLG
jgi:hypothetical protein